LLALTAACANPPAHAHQWKGPTRPDARLPDAGH
jgi:hypothetical protein